MRRAPNVLDPSRLPQSFSSAFSSERLTVERDKPLPEDTHNEPRRMDGNQRRRLPRTQSCTDQPPPTTRPTKTTPYKRGTTSTSPPIPCQRLTKPTTSTTRAALMALRLREFLDTSRTDPAPNDERPMHQQLASFRIADNKVGHTDHIAPACALTPLSHRAPLTQAELRHARRVRVTPKSPPADGYVWVRLARPPPMHRTGSPTHPACAPAQIDCQFYGFWIAKDKAERYQPRHTQVQQVAA